MDNPNLMVRYVGAKDSETDCVAGTGITWTGKGDVQLVPAKAWDIMSRHADVWELVVDEPEPAAAVTGLAAATIVAGSITTGLEFSGTGATGSTATVVEPAKPAKPVAAAKKAVPAKKVVAAKKAVAAKKPAAKAPAKADASA